MSCRQSESGQETFTPPRWQKYIVVGQPIWNSPPPCIIGDLKHMWSDINKVIDTLHIHNHKDAKCRQVNWFKWYHNDDVCTVLIYCLQCYLFFQLYNPDNLKDKYPDFNTMSCEQTFAWLSRFKKILAAMSKVHHHFYIHRMVVKRNKYISYCYKVGRRPVQPKVKSTCVIDWRDPDKQWRTPIIITDI